MEWLNKKSNFLRGDLREFSFHPQKNGTIQTLLVRSSHSLGQTTYSHKLDHKSGDEYARWLGSVELPVNGSREECIILVMHPRLDGQGKGTGETVPFESTALPYNESTFQLAAQRLCQHRSLAFSLGRLSTTVFNSRTVAWEQPEGSSIVYNCKSDTASPSSSDDPSDIAMSVTSFVDQSTTYAVMYGCTEDVMEQTSDWLEIFGGQALHPLVMPMVFAELERKRLLNMLDAEESVLKQRILNLENKLRGEASAAGTLAKAKSLEKTQEDVESQVQDCESTKLWIDVSSLKNGLESLKAELEKMVTHSEELATTALDGHAEKRKTGERIEARLREMVAEINSKVRSCDSLLGGMALAAQMESNYYTRRDARAAMIIANHTKRDGSQMRSISLLGMIFLPGTFLASIFSMTFFDWGAPTSREVISPWIAIYFALAIGITVITVWRMKMWMAQEELRARTEMKNEMGSDSDSMA
ncbi:hypothetical protein CPLU01_13596 [Colletotrichum plurivorum]|uniref:Uncharacterized protein n=1 Tax=Colletotrichum plurivorum TaxID=2175906 RepID=A0A8H6JRB7_9PEZI|nr:hypothetical protein CPLU01_13596 [Colletotrichum plurivorum]